ncbi:hypothetical protein AC578_5287 [Pseudocercospora eumusae]|uniref:Uncharacterized protein n=1 Tax=Pseudocercospora eumusae TaxID=321146 RepID=A0A139GYV0_9PEZI|nr:hypothetical protein AC578_5287 [Pseudocercospora eumusae]
MVTTRVQRSDSKTDSYSSSPSQRQERNERRMSTSTFIKQAERLAENYHEDITKIKFALDRSTKLVENLLTNLQTTERNRDLAFDLILEEMEQKGLPTEAVEAVISRALMAPYRASMSSPVKGEDSGELGRVFCYCVLVPLVCCLWFGVFMAIRDGKLSWQTIVLVRDWLAIYCNAFVTWAEAEAFDRWQIVKAFLGLTDA